MKKLMLLMLALTIGIALSGIGALSHATPPPPPPAASEVVPITKSPPMLDTKQELATPKPKAPMDLVAPGELDKKLETPEPKEDKTKSTK